MMYCDGGSGRYGVGLLTCKGFGIFLEPSDESFDRKIGEFENQHELQFLFTYLFAFTVNSFA